MSGRKWTMLTLLLVLGAATASAQDAKTVIQKAQKAMGDVNSIQYSGTGKAGGSGRTGARTCPGTSPTSRATRRRLTT